MEGLPEGVDSKFRYVLLVSKRAEQLIQGAQPKMRSRRHAKPTRVAMEEIDTEPGEVAAHAAGRRTTALERPSSESASASLRESTTCRHEPPRPSNRYEYRPRRLRRDRGVQDARAGPAPAGRRRGRPRHPHAERGAIRLAARARRGLAITA